MADVANAPILEVQKLKKNFGAVHALNEVTLEIHPGEVLALVGDNGAGKSTTVKIIAGVEQPSAGELMFEGQPVLFRNPADAAQHGIQTVYQDLALCDNLSIVANLYLGRELRQNLVPKLVSTLSKIDMEEQATPVLEGLEINLPPLDTPVASLSGGQRQAVAVARAVLWGSKLVLLDEPTAALGVAQTRMVLNLITQLAKNGLGVIVISHNLGDVFEVADRIVVLRQGRTVGTHIRSEVTPEQVIADITGASEGGGVYA